MMKVALTGAGAAAVLAAALTAAPPAGAAERSMMGVNVVLRGDITPAALADLEARGDIVAQLPQIDSVVMRARVGDLAGIRSQPYVAAANPDASRHAAPVDTVEVTDFAHGLNTWNLDAVGVTDLGAGRTLSQDGSGVYVAVLDTGLLDTWREYFPQERIAERFGKAFSGGGGEVGRVSEPRNVWEHDTNSHGTHVTSTVLGYDLRGVAVNGAAPGATVIPVKVLGQGGFGWSSMVAAGIVYATDLKKNALGDAPLVINMSLGGSALDAVEKAALDYAVENGVIVVASAGNSGTEGMGYPGAYAPVISVAASGWTGQWTSSSWWQTADVPDPTSAENFYIADFSSRELQGQDLDIAAPGSWVVGPYQLQSGFTSYYYLGGTSMAAPHVAGIAALMAQKDPDLRAAEAEEVLEHTATPLPPGCRTVIDPVQPQPVCWADNATGAGLVVAADALAALD